MFFDDCPHRVFLRLAAPCVVAASLLIGPTALAVQASAQTSPHPNAIELRETPDDPAIRAEDEIIVEGLSPRGLREQIVLAEDALFERFNEVNDDEELDIVCQRRVELGSRIPKRYCAPRIWLDMEEDWGLSILLTWFQERAGHANIGQYIGAQHYKRLALLEKMRTLVMEDPVFFARLERLAALRQASRDDAQQRRANR